MESPPNRTSRGSGDLATALAAIESKPPSGPVKLPCPAAEHARSPHANRRAALGLVLVGLLVGGVFQLLTMSPDIRNAPTAGSRAAVVFSNAQAGSCLSWPPDAP